MSVQKRPLTGMVDTITGAALPVVAPAAPLAKVIHTLDATSSQLGGPFIDMVTLLVNNADPAATHDIKVTIGGVPMQVTIPRAANVALLVDNVFQSGSAGPAQITVSDVDGTGHLTAWGFFARPL
jgi:hypothetical protein